MIAHQTLIYGLQPEARGRLNALLFTTVFIGMAIGSVLGSEALEKAGWPAVVGLSVMAGIGSLIVRLRKDAR
jgi:MFS family permease